MFSSKGRLSFITLLVMLILSSISLFAQFAGGQGTADEPWLIETAEHLDAVRNYTGAQHNNKYFKQTADIDLGVAPWNEVNGWLPIGDRDKKFHGHYDGGGHKISGIKIIRPYSNNVGLFGICLDATIKNLSVVDFNISAVKWVGGIAGDFGGSNEDHPALMTNCHTSGVVKGTSRIGGLVGYGARSHFKSCSSTAKVISIDEMEAHSGGLIGYAHTWTEISDCFARGNIENTQKGAYSGGLIGLSVGSIIRKCYSTGSVTGGERTGGLIGGFFESQLQYCYWDSEASGMTISGAGDKRVTAEMVFPHNPETYYQWDFNDTWLLDMSYNINDGYPYLGKAEEEPSNAVVVHPENEMKNADVVLTLSWKPTFNENYTNTPSGFILSFGADYPPSDILDNVDLGAVLTHTLKKKLEVGTVYYWQVKAYNSRGVTENSPIWSFETYSPGTFHFDGGSGTKEDPWKVRTAEQLSNISKYLSSINYYVQTGDIDLQETDPDNAEGWTPIGSSSAFAFKGVYDGNNYIISNLFIERKNKNNQGLFGYLLSGTVKNVRVVNATVSGNDYVGILVGNMAKSSRIINCHTEGTVAGVSFVGGLAGRSNESGSFYSSSVGNVEGNGFVGGLFGDSQNGIVNNSFSRCGVEGMDRVGGLLGNASSSSILHSYSAGMVTGHSNVGGLVGKISSMKEEVSNYWDIDVSGQTDSAIGQGKTTAEMIYPFGTDTYVDWDFEGIWSYDRSLIINDGYPFISTEIDLIVEKDRVVKPLLITLQNYPNPFNPETTIMYNLRESSEVKLMIYDIKGRLVKKLVNERQTTGEYRVVWDGKDETGSIMPSGIYFAKLVTQQGVKTTKMMLLK